MSKLHRVIAVFILLLVLAPLTSFAANEYYSEDGQVRFTIPEGWSEEPLSKNCEILKVKYVCDDSPFEIICFGFKDIWGSIPKSELDGLTREDFDSEFFTSSDIANMYNTYITKIGSETYNNMKYYSYTFSQNVTEQGVSIQLEIKTYICIYNGFLYQFSFKCIVGEDHNYDDFKALIKSVEYLTEFAQEPQTTEQTTLPAQASETPPDYENPYESSSVAIWVLLAAIAFIIIMLILKSKAK